MNWILANGREIKIYPYKYRIDWAKTAPSQGAQFVKSFLKKFCFNDIVYEEFRIPTTKMRFDFLNQTKRFIIEFHGKQHEEYNAHFFKSRAGYLNSIKRDGLKLLEAERNRYKLIELYVEDLDFLTRDFLKNKFNVTV